MPSKRQGLRIFHHKSRYGCTRCKQRKVKCNMQVSVCSNCNRRGETCEYQRIGAFSWSHTEDLSLRQHKPADEVMHAQQGFLVEMVTSSDKTNGRPLAIGISTRTYIQQPLDGDKFCWLLKAVLDRSWFTTTESGLWIQALSSKAESNPYLYHCIVSLAALQHRSPGQSKNTHPALAYKHHVQASEIFRHTAPIVTKHNWLAVLAFQVFVLVFELTSQTHCRETQFNVVRTLEVFRWNSAIGRDANPHFVNSKLYQLVVMRTAGQELPPDPALWASLQVLGSTIAHTANAFSKGSPQHEHALLCQEAFERLCTWVDFCVAWPRRFDHYYYWPLSLELRFLEILAERHESAVLVLLYWSVVLWRSPMPAIWKWAYRTAHFALQILKEKDKWHGVLVWPRHVLSTSVPKYGIA